ncbi:MAG: glycosyltransferase family 2 protein [Planctomycetota bacterium]|jgi:glycosyltransferase
MKVSIITPCRNAESTISDCLASVERQTHPDVEHVVVDGGSTDGTLEAIRRPGRRVARVLSGPDRGMYDAINKGLDIVTGDVVGVLNADDVYQDERVAADVAGALETTGAATCYGDLVYVSADDTRRVVRYWRAGPYRRGAFRSRGWMPPHPTFFVRREVYERFGALRDRDFRIAADYELMMRLLEKHGLSTCYIPRVLVRMRTGGMSNRGVRNIIRKSLEDLKAMRVNDLRGGLYTLALKNLRKLPQFLRGSGM